MKVRDLEGEAGLNQCPWRRQEDNGTNQRVVEHCQARQTFVWSRRQEWPKVRT